MNTLPIVFIYKRGVKNIMQGKAESRQRIVKFTRLVIGAVRGFVERRPILGE